MTTEEIADLFQAKPIGRGRYQALCPSHRDQKPSLAISSGLHGKILLKCWAGCSVVAILGAAGLSISELFPSSKPLTRAQREEFLRKKAARQTWNEARVEYSREVFDRERMSEICVQYLGSQLALIPDGSADEKRLIQEFHAALDEFRRAERESERAISLNRSLWPVTAIANHGGRELVAA
jgi:hypothetical protein